MKVKLEDLNVESFDTTSDVSDTRGTVNAHDASVPTCKWSCVPAYTCPECAYP